MSSDDNEQTPTRKVLMANVKGAMDNQDDKDEKVQFISAINTPYVVKEESLKASRRDTETDATPTDKKLQLEYDRLEKELKRLRELSDTTSPRKIETQMHTKSKVSQMTQDKNYPKKPFEIKKKIKQSTITDVNDEFKDINDEAKQEQQLEKILSQVTPYHEEAKQSLSR